MKSGTPAHVHFRRKGDHLGRTWRRAYTSTSSHTCCSGENDTLIVAQCQASAGCTRYMLYPREGEALCVEDLQMLLHKGGYPLPNTRVRGFSNSLSESQKSNFFYLQVRNKICMSHWLAVPSCFLASFFFSPRSMFRACSKGEHAYPSFQTKPKRIRLISRSLNRKEQTCSE